MKISRFFILFALIIISTATLIPWKESLYGKQSTLFFIRHFWEQYKNMEAHCCNKYEKLSSYLHITLKIKAPQPDRSYGPTTNDHILGFDVTFYDYRSLCYLYREIFLDEIYFFQTNNPQPFIIDCGSNIGMTVLYFKKLYPQSRILAFEPAKSNYALLEKNVTNNNLNDISLIKKALFNKTDSLKLYEPGSTAGTIQDTLARQADYEIVETTPLSSYIDQKVDFLKLDIEGSETVVLEELAEKNKLKFIEEIIMEFHYNNQSNNNRLSTLLKILEDNHFKFLINGGSGLPFKKDTKPVIKAYYLIHAYR
jgi:FkbM family methyltransferase